MSEVELTEQLDQAIEAMLANPGAPLRVVDSSIVEMLGIAAELRDLPRVEFKARLQSELEEEATMRAATKKNSDKVDPVRKGFRTITPYLVVPDVHAEIDFLRKAFDAVGQIYGLGSQGGFHAEYRIGESILMIGGGGKGSAWKGTALPAALHLYVEDVDATYQRAVQAGATSLYAPMDQPYGDRDCAIQDAGGNQWYLGTRKHAASTEGQTNLMPYLHPVGAPKMIEFLKQAFGAEELAVHQTPDGVVRHATVRIGTSVVEMGEAHDQWQPMPMVFMLYVDDVDAWYARAAAAKGAVAKEEPKVQPHGARMGSVKDPFDNVWYIASQVVEMKEEPPEP
jgi:PhnB protein